jgi:4-diphosphocytidyl-2-C-methyl-D-erythritol kinase
VCDTDLTLPSYAKINWSLHVLGRRADGLHELHTVFQTITLQDSLSFSLRDDGRLSISCDVQGIPVDESNLVHRAGTALRERYRIKLGAAVHLAKRIPAEGGLGGGSSNAAIALLGLAHLWNLKITRDELSEIGARLGADVPFFFTGGTALGTGLGASVERLQEVSAEHLLVLTPKTGVSTADAYKQLKARALTKNDGDIILSISRARAPFTDSLPYGLYNDFERVVVRSGSEIERAKNALLNAGARGALLSGSGSSVFGIFDNGEERESAASALRAETGWRVFPCATLARADYYRALGRCAAPLERALSSATQKGFDIGA